MATDTTQAVQPALLFMPDITGFTEFVSNTEITHAQSIIQEVLEIIINSNQLNFKVGEIEGDAIFFYRLGNLPQLDQLLSQVQTMFTRFHQHLKLYSYQRICPCAACTSASELKLKFIAHFGEVAGYAVNNQQKLFGKDVIIIHRLLKNSLNKKEYVLMTNPVVEGAKELNQLPNWYYPEEFMESYDVGEVKFKIADLTNLKEELPPVDPSVSKSFAKAKTVFSEERVIPAPASNVFTPIFDLSQREKWMDGVKKIELVSNDLINRIGTKHRCVLNNNSSSILITEYATLDKDKVELIEMDEKGIAGCRYQVQQLGENETKLKVDLLIRKNPLILTIYNLFMKNKLENRIRRSLDNLYSLCVLPLS
jgi:hypothetical protein